MKLYHSILEFLYQNREKGFLGITHICLNPNLATLVAKEMKEEGVIELKQRRFQGENRTFNFISPPRLAITPLGIEKYKSLYLLN
ncbi:hypothetical protein HCG49_10395 [Arenibacter sp. 6A1]|uniref:hypothetical protein n=1 Tax=Arenibacter sp. 6A1 TaxID=2720391 RepID=UPI0014452547|nr:hypothetical protein [Arenibacter sp. 6A1]NKI26971.1 hypothetical protein [Arenibacter sp. 6A1]